MRPAPSASDQVEPGPFLLPSRLGETMKQPLNDARENRALVTVTKRPREDQRVLVTVKPRPAEPTRNITLKIVPQPVE